MGGINHQQWVAYYCYTHIIPAVDGVINKPTTGGHHPLGWDMGRKNIFCDAEVCQERGYPQFIQVMDDYDLGVS